jgi:hypothetical protein
LPFLVPDADSRLFRFDAFPWATIRVEISRFK